MPNRFALLPEHLNIVERFVDLGRFAEPHAVIGAALNLLEGRERERTASLSALHDALARDAEPAAPGGLGFDPDETLREIEQLLGLKTAPALREAC